MLEAKTISHIGKQREGNEDAVVENESVGLWVVADGVGGNAHGEVASQLACQTIERRIRQGDALISSIMEANQAIIEAIDANSEFNSMATTVVACHFDAGHFELAWVGDSRAYLIDQSGICQITQDHNVANELYEKGEIDEIEAENHRGQHELTQALGQLSLEQIPRNLGELHDGDYLLLCTDGLSGVMSDNDILSTIRQGNSLEAISQSLLDQVLEAGAPDNVSFSLIRYQTDEPSIKASDFGEKGLRAPFDRSSYALNCKYRPLLLAVILISIFVLFFFI